MTRAFRSRGVSVPVDFWGERVRGVLGEEFRIDWEIWSEGVVDEAR